MDTAWHRVCASEALAEGRAQRYPVDTVDVLVARVGGALHAVHNLCTHADACLHEGRLRGARLICPLHGASFDIRTGAVLAKPATLALQCFEVREADGAIFVRLPPTPDS